MTRPMVGHVPSPASLFLPLPPNSPSCKTPNTCRHQHCCQHAVNSRGGQIIAGVPDTGTQWVGQVIEKSNLTRIYVMYAMTPSSSRPLWIVLGVLGRLAASPRSSASVSGKKKAKKSAAAKLLASQVLALSLAGLSISISHIASHIPKTSIPLTLNQSKPPSIVSRIH